MPYASIPTKAVFESNSRFLTAHRNREPLTIQVDNALSAYHGAVGTGFRKQFALVMLFWSCDRWLKHVGGATGQFSADARRRPAMMELYKVVVDTLSTSTGVHHNSLPNWLQTTFGRDMGAHGIGIDVGRNLAKTLTPQELEKYRLHFSDGKAYQKDWWARGAGMVLADSKTCTMLVRRELDEAHIGFSGYALTLAQDFYMAPHFVESNDQASFSGNFYHSSYRGGGTVACAGTIRIVSGEVKEITNKSGHYAPTTGQLVFAVETLRMLGVDMTALNVDGYGLERQTAAHLLADTDLEEVARQNAEASLANDLSRRTWLKGLDNTIREEHEDKQRRVQILLAHWGPLGPHKGSPKGFVRARCSDCMAYEDFWKEADRIAQARA